jgi:spermidine synthase
VVSWLFLLAYTCSGFAGLVYEVSWTRLWTLVLGRGLPASSTVLAAFMGGLAVGAAVGGRWTTRMDRVQALRVYAALELAIAMLAIALPFELHALSPLFAMTYRDGDGGAVFALMRLSVCLTLVFVPAVVLGATFPMAVRFFAQGAETGGRRAGALYAVNTIGAAGGAVLAAFVLIPALGLRRTVMVAVAASITAAIVAVALVRWIARTAGQVETHESRPTPRTDARRGRPRHARMVERASAVRPRLAATLLAITGAATFMAEVGWTRVFGMLVGPSTYGFAATIAAFIGGLAIGSSIGTLVVGRTRRVEVAVGVALGFASLASVWAATAAGTSLPHRVLVDFAAGPPGGLLARHVLLVAITILPLAICIGVAFPLLLEIAGGPTAPARIIGAVYAVNTVAAVGASLAAGFVVVPLLGLERTLQVVSAMLAVGSVVSMLAVRELMLVRAGGLIPLAAGAALSIGTAPWDRDLLASGPYKYASSVPPGLDVETTLKSGTLIYYRDGSTATVSVKRLTGTLSLSIDGKVDASTGGDMLTQKLLAHVPLLLHDDPREICIIGLGSGVTLAAALTHPVRAVDVLEISPEVVEASRLFANGGRPPIDDPRTRLIVADGRTHLAFTRHRYDVIVSEPSNPWMAGVAALFTRELFEAARAHLAEHGIICQWVNTYDISRGDLQSIVATFASVFPHANMWLVGDSDLLLVGFADPLDGRLEAVARNWPRPGVAPDLRTVAVTDPFGVLSTFLAGDEGVKQFAAGAALQVDDRMALEFSAPRALRTPAARENVAALRAVARVTSRPRAVEAAWASAGAAQLIERAAMLRRAGAFGAAYDAARVAVERAPDDRGALQLLVETAVATGRQTDAMSFLDGLCRAHPTLAGPELSLSRLQVATGAVDAAVMSAGHAARNHPDDGAALEQLASIFADVGDAERLAPVVMALSHFPDRAGSHYYAAAGNFLRGNLDAAQAAASYALTLDPTLARARNLLGAIAATRGDLASARAAFQAALETDPRDPATYRNLALLELNTGNSQAAARLFSEALTLDPSSEAAREGLARATAATR